MTSNQLELMRLMEAERANRANEALKQGSLAIEQELAPAKKAQLEADVENVLKRLELDSALIKEKTFGQTLANMLLEMSGFLDTGVVDSYYNYRYPYGLTEQLETNKQLAKGRAVFDKVFGGTASDLARYLEVAAKYAS